jgi:proteasome beta subunit
MEPETNIKLNVLELSEGQVKDYQPVLEKAKTGTTTVALKVMDGVVMATDNRATMGLFIASKTAKKLHRIQDYMYLTIAGGVADAQYLIDVLRAETEIYNLRNENKMGVRAAGKLLQNICYQNKGYFEVGLMLAGATTREGAVLFDVDGYGSLLEEDYASVGSGSLFAIGVLETEWKEGLELEEGMNLAVKAVRSAILRDIASGNGIDVVGIKAGSPPIERSYKVTDKALINNTFAESKGKK